MIEFLEMVLSLFKKQEEGGGYPRIAYVVLALIGLFVLASTAAVIYAAVNCRPVKIGEVELAEGLCRQPAQAGDTGQCPASGGTDADTLFALIDAEAQAVLNERYEDIARIYDGDAVIRNAATGEEFTSPEVYYSEKFKNEVHCELVHSSYEVVRIAPTEALVTTGSRGYWGWEPGPCSDRYEGLPGSDEWLFSKGQDGCWRIARLTFNLQPAQ